MRELYAVLVMMIVMLVAFGALVVSLPKDIQKDKDQWRRSDMSLLGPLFW